MLDTSVLGELTADACAAVTGRQDAAALLREHRRRPPVPGRPRRRADQLPLPPPGPQGAARRAAGPRPRPRAPAPAARRRIVRARRRHPPRDPPLPRRAASRPGPGPDARPRRHRLPARPGAAGRPRPVHGPPRHAHRRPRPAAGPRGRPADCAVTRPAAASTSTCSSAPSRRSRPTRRLAARFAALQSLPLRADRPAGRGRARRPDRAGHPGADAAHRRVDHRRPADPAARLRLPGRLRGGRAGGRRGAGDARAHRTGQAGAGARRPGAGLVRGRPPGRGRRRRPRRRGAARRLGFDQHFFAVDYLRALAGLALERRDLDTAEHLTEQALSITERRRPSSSSWPCSTGPRSGPPAGSSATRWPRSSGRAPVLAGTRSPLLARADEPKRCSACPSATCARRRAGHRAARRPPRPAAGQDRPRRRRSPRRAPAPAGTGPGRA